jgi:Fur family ferric uptake transcriptional regulator
MISSTQSHSPFVAPEPGSVPDRVALVARLRTFRLRVTAPRIAVLEILSTAEQPLTIDQVFSKTGDGMCDLVTIYRAMAAFETAGLIYRCGFSTRGAAIFSLDNGGARKYPLLRKGSAVAEELDAESARELTVTIDRIRNRLKARGYGELDHIVEFFAAAPSPAFDPGL